VFSGLDLAQVMERVSAVETAQPLFAALGGGAAVGSVLAIALELQRSEPRWDRAAAYGSVGGALFGAILLAIDISHAV
jgi:hypothetical protein